MVLKSSFSKNRLLEEIKIKIKAYNKVNADYESNKKDRKASFL
jgi:hypothetical protein